MKKSETAFSGVLSFPGGASGQIPEEPEWRIIIPTTGGNCLHPKEILGTS